ncbi:hypothetical protein OGH69_12875 [Flavobacterium sp. MFBS3-15]|uniref:GldL-related protein n=1 Tax=Flavobacterium sp. MFBS3-15 TaxID=2989816 RepID=UPI002235E376|nr:hypothetical protein [Flavobacterium sp. MFBS3-15]MCW4469866.1 hypothetical protein [Flavobacterium sp. MFBS3-15]
MKKSVYVFGFLASFLLSSGIMFKMMHWPSASIQLIVGFIVLNFGFLPVYFYQKAKAAQ